MSRDYRLILPLMLATVLATLLSEHLRRNSIYTLKLTRRGIRLERGHDIDVMQGIEVGEAMTTQFATVPADMPLTELARLFRESHHPGFPVLDANGDLVGVVTVQDLERATSRGDVLNLTADDITTRSLRVAYPDEPLWAALKRMGTRDIGRLSVVSRANPRQFSWNWRLAPIPPPWARLWGTCNCPMSACSFRCGADADGSSPTAIRCCKPGTN